METQRYFLIEQHNLLVDSILIFLLSLGATKVMLMLSRLLNAANVTYRGNMERLAVCIMEVTGKEMIFLLLFFMMQTC